MKEIDMFQFARRSSFWAYKSQYTKLLISAFVLSFAFDFNGAVGGAASQFIMASLNMITFILLAFKFGIRLPTQGGVAFVFWGWLLYLLFGSFGALASDVPPGQFIRIIYPVILFLEGFLVAWWASRSGYQAELVRVMMWAAVISFVFTVFWGFYFTGRSIDTIRYQILSPLIPFLLIVAGFDLVFARRHRMVALFLITATLGVIALSVTRGMILPIAIIIGVVFLAAIWNLLRGRGNIPAPLIRVVLWGGGVAIVSIVIGLVLVPDILQRWILRSLGSHSNVTFWTRAAAVSGQWDQLILNPVALFIGRGFGHSYMYDQAFTPLVYPDMSSEVFTAPMWYPGEFMWITPVFYAGFAAGGLAIIILLFGLVKAFFMLIKLLRYQTWGIPVYRPLWLALLGFFAFIGLSFTANPFIGRQAPLFMGLCMGLFIALECHVMRRLDT